MDKQIHGENLCFLQTVIKVEQATCPTSYRKQKIPMQVSDPAVQPARRLWSLSGFT